VPDDFLFFISTGLRRPSKENAMNIVDAAKEVIDAWYERGVTACIVPIQALRKAVEDAEAEGQEPVNCEAIAKLFHDTYECLAPSFGYETRQETKHFDSTSPNGKLMIAVCEVMYLMTPPVAEGMMLVPITDCPNCNNDGAYHDRYGTVYQCQWCDLVPQSRYNQNKAMIAAAKVKS
jgi:hypothetical protein